MSSSIALRGSGTYERPVLSSWFYAAPRSARSSVFLGLLGVVAPCLLALMAAGCGARTELLTVRAVLDAGSRRDGGDATTVQDAAAAPACRVAWSACQPGRETTDVVVSGTESGQLPDIAWDGRELLIAYGSETGNKVVGVSLTGTVLWREPVGGTQWPRITWNAALNVGVVVMDSGVRWLDSAGRINGPFVSATVPGSQLYGAAIPTRRGFTVLSGTNAYAIAPELYVAAVGPTPGPRVDFLLATNGAPRSPPEFTTGADGLATYVVSTVWHSMRGDFFPVAPDGVIQPAIPLDMHLSPSSHVAGVAERNGIAFVLSATTTSQLVLNTVTNDVVSDPLVLDFTAPRANSGHLARLGDDILVAGERSSHTPGVQVGVLDMTITGGIGARTVVGSTESQSPRLTVTPRGVAIVWNEPDHATSGLAAHLTVLECCMP